MGLALMIGAMLLETVLFVIRTTVPPRLEHEMHAQKQKRKQHATSLEHAADNTKSIADVAKIVLKKKE